MARKPLTETQLKAVRPRERIKKYSDAHSGLYLVVAPTGGRWWRVRLTRDGEEQHVSIGTYPEVGLDAARSRAAQLRLAKKNGDATATAALAAELRGAERPHPTPRPAPAGYAFGKVAESWLTFHTTAPSTRVRNARVVGYLVGELGPATLIGAIDTPTLRAALQRIEPRGGETARRALTLGAAIWRHAMANGVTDRNPMSGLKSQEIFAKVKEQRYAAITNPNDLGGLLRAINGYDGQPVTKIALQILARTFVRPGELRLALWQQVDFDDARPQLVIPAARTKMRESDHIVPLAKQTVALLRELERHRGNGDLLCPSLRPGRPLSDNTFNAALRALGYSNDVHVAHGFRSTASTLLHEKGFDAELVETQLAHARPGVRGIYMRSHLLEQRRAMMQSWADYLDELARGSP